MTVAVHIVVDEEKCESFIRDQVTEVLNCRCSDPAAAAETCDYHHVPSVTLLLADEATTESTTDDGQPRVDPWRAADTVDCCPGWTELGVRGKLYRVLVQWLGKIVALLTLLYFFICSLDLLGSAFRLLGGKAAGAVFSDSSLLQNPIAGLMIGVLATVLLQSSSTSTSIVVTMVASGLLKVQPAIPIIMGANIGTSVTNTIVSLAQSANRDEFRRAFAGATVHDMFNWLTVFILLPLEMATGYLYHLTSMIVGKCSLTAGFSGGNKDMLQTITKPFTELIVQLDKKVIEGIATGDETYAAKSLIKEWCGYSMAVMERNVTTFVDVVIVPEEINSTLSVIEITNEQNVSVSIPVKHCTFLFYNRGLNDTVVGVILLICSLLLLCGSLILMVKILNSALRGSVLTTVKRCVNAELPGYGAYFTGYIAMVVGALMTIVVQSSSVFTSVLTPLVGVGVVAIERMYPLTLGSNMGTTTTGILAALAAPADQLMPALQIALCHMFFNLNGILLFYPIPCLRLPIKLAKLMGNTTARYRWFAIFYVVVMFFVAPLIVFALSLAGSVVLIVVISLFFFTASCVIIINVLQHRRPHWLPTKLQSWNFLPVWLHSLDPADRLVQRVMTFFSKFCCCCRHWSHSDNVPPFPADKEKQPMITMISTLEKIADIDLGSDVGISFTATTDDNESGYGSVPPSRIQSFVQLSQLAAADSSERSIPGTAATATPAPSRLPSLARIQFEAIVEVDSDETQTQQSSTPR